MKKNPISVLLVMLLFLTSCSKSDNPAETRSETVKDVTITSYSKNLAYSGDEVIITGENFPAKEKCKIYFDDTAVEIINVSADAKTMTIKIPMVPKPFPVLKFVFEKRSHVNNVSNKYDQNIAIINKSVGNWTSTPNQFSFTDARPILNIQIRENGRIYFNYAEKTISSLDDGLTWNLWCISGDFGNFHATDNDEGWSDGGASQGELVKVPVGGTSSLIKSFYTNPTKKEFAAVYVENDMKTGLLVSQDRNVYKTANGVDFNKVHSSTSTMLDVQRPPFKLDFNNIWAIGSNQTTEKGLILYCNGNNENWHEYSFLNYPKSIVDDIYFVNNKVGYCSLSTYDSAPTVKLFKSIDGGVSWSPITSIPNIQRNLSMAFIDENTGYVSSDNKIYLTKDGGASWALDYTAEANIQKLGYANNCVYAITNGKMNRKFLK